MTRELRATASIVALAALAVVCVPVGGAEAAAPVRSVPVSGPNPFTECPASGPGALLPAGAQEPSVVINPRDPANIVAAWQQGQDRGVVAGVSFDRGRTWRRSWSAG